MLEKRKFKRRHLIYYLRVFDRNTDILIGHMVDITQDGIRLIGEHPVDIGKIFMLKMVLPSEILGRDRLHFDALCVRCQKDINPDFYDIAFQLLNVSRKHLLVIEQLVDDLGFQN